MLAAVRGPDRTSSSSHSLIPNNDTLEMSPGAAEPRRQGERLRAARAKELIARRLG